MICSLNSITQNSIKEKHTGFFVEPNGISRKTSRQLLKWITVF